jgi:hypothetical protein
MSDFFGYLFELLLQKRLIRRVVILVLIVGTFYNAGKSTTEGWIALAILIAFGVFYEIADFVTSRRRANRQR